MGNKKSFKGGNEPDSLASSLSSSPSEVQIKKAKDLKKTARESRRFFSQHTRVPPSTILDLNKPEDEQKISASSPFTSIEEGNRKTVSFFSQGKSTEEETDDKRAHYECES